MTQKGPTTNNKPRTRRKLRTNTVLDGYSIATNGVNNSETMSNQDLQITKRAHTSKSLVIESLLEQLCNFHEQDQGKRKKLFHVICKNLSSLRVLGDSFQLETMQPVRLKFRIAFEKYIIDVKNSIEILEQPESEMLLSIAIPDWNRKERLASCLYQYCVPKSDFYELFPQQYEREFEELDMIAKGGFGVVCKARKKVDQVEYAVKKIPFSFNADPLIPKVLHEVELFARLSHTNIVNYKTAWIEEETGDISGLFQSSEETSIESISAKSEAVCEVTREKFPFERNERDSFSYDDCTKLSDLEYSDILDKMCNSIEVFENKNVNFCKRDSADSIEFVETESSSLIEEKEDIIRRRHRSGSTNKSMSDSELEIGDAIDPICQRTFCRDRNTSLVPAYIRSQSTTVDDNISLNVKAVLYVQMELCKESLRCWLDRRNKEEKQVDSKKVTDIFKQILKGVYYLHNQGFIHRDLKPQNVLFDYHDKVKIGDFGLATACCGLNLEPFKRFRRNLNQSHSQGVGTSPYAAPEVKDGTTYDTKADIYSLGVILLELFYPFGTSMERAKVLDQLVKMRLPNEFQEKYPEQTKMILKLTHSDPKTRPDALQVLNSTLFLSKSQINAKLREENEKLKIELASKDKEIAKLKAMLKLQFLDDC